MSRILIGIFLIIAWDSSSQHVHFTPIIESICDSTIELNKSELTPNSEEFADLIRHAKNTHSENWHAAYENYYGHSLTFDKFFYHILLRNCPDFLNSKNNNLYFYSKDTINENRYNNIRKLLVDMELSDTLRMNKYAFLDSIRNEQKDSLTIVVAPFLKTIAVNSYLDTKQQVNKAKETYIRVTYINHLTNSKEYELHFYFTIKDALTSDRIVFISKEEIDRDEEIRKARMNSFPPPPLPDR